MRNVVTDFYCGVLEQLIASGRLSTSDTVLRALLEMYRVARKAVIAFEARDS